MEGLWSKALHSQSVNKLIYIIATKVVEQQKQFKKLLDHQNCLTFKHFSDANATIAPYHCLHSSLLHVSTYKWHYVSDKCLVNY